MESISPTNLHNGKRHQHKVKGAKLLFDFTKICAEILQQILGYSFCSQHHILAQCCQMLLQKSIFFQKLLCFGAKIFVKLTPQLEVVLMQSMTLS
jgi:hypothetical protein